MKLKGIVLAVILSLASIMMPFDVYAAVQSQIVPTFSSSTSQWNGHLYVTNFSDGTNNQASSTLSFTFDDDYYGIIYFDGYGPSNQHIANFAACFVAGGYGEYRYSFYQNEVINITSVTIQIVNVVKPDSSVDLTQIITLLTAIENDTSSIDNVLDSTLAEIRNVLSQLIISNGYLETLTKLRQWNIPFESLPFYAIVERQGFDLVSFYNYRYFQFPVYTIPSNRRIFLAWHNMNRDSYMIFGSSRNFSDLSTFNNYFSFVDIIDSSKSINLLDLKQMTTYASNLIIYKLTYRTTSSSNYELKNIASNNDVNFIPIFWSNNANSNVNISTDFALQFGLSNRLLDDLDIIANGTNQSNTAASDLESSNDQMADDMDDLATIENSYNQQFNNQLQSIDFTNPIQNNAGILPAANFVISIFNGLINNNPFSVLIIVVCILLIGKKVIGR